MTDNQPIKWGDAKDHPGVSGQPGAANNLRGDMEGHGATPTADQRLAPLGDDQATIMLALINQAQQHIGSLLESGALMVKMIDAIRVRLERIEASAPPDGWVTVHRFKEVGGWHELAQSPEDGQWRVTGQPWECSGATPAEAVEAWRKTKGGT